MLRKLWRWLRQQDLVDRLDKAIDYQIDERDRWVADYQKLMKDFQTERAKRLIEEERVNTLTKRLANAEARAAATDSQAHQAAHHYRGIGKSVVSCHQIAVKLLADHQLVPLYSHQLRIEFGADAVDPVLEAMQDD